MSTTLKAKFRKYSVELEPNTEREQAADCFISYKTAVREYTASLQCAIDTGELVSNDGYVHLIDAYIVDDIEVWAVENGY